MRCGKVRKRLVDFAEGMLREADRAAVEQHLAACESCRSEFSEIEGLKKDLLSLEKPGRDAGSWERFDENLSRRLTGELEKEALAKIGRKRPGLFGLSPTVANVAALALILIFILMGVERLGDAPEKNTDEPGGIDDVALQAASDVALSDEDVIDYFLSGEGDDSGNGFDEVNAELALLMEGDLVEQVDEMVLSELYEQDIYEYMEDFSEEELEEVYEGLASI